MTIHVRKKMQDKGESKGSIFTIGPIRSNAWLGYSGEANTTFHIASGYYDCYKIVYQELKKSNFSQLDNIAHPLFYLIRHSFELYLKTFIEISKLAKSSHNNKDNKIHDIHSLFLKARDSMFNTTYKIKKIDVQTVEKAVKDFHSVDPGSITFRYPSDKKGDPIFEEPKIINIVNFHKEISKTNRIFEKWIDVFNYLMIKYKHIEGTENFTPWEIADIARLFPGSFEKKYRNIALDIIKKNKDHKISEIEFEVIFEKIQSSRILSPHIGIVQPLKYLNYDDLQKIQNIYKQWQNKILKYNKENEADYDSDGSSNFDFDMIAKYSLYIEQLYEKLVTPYFDTDQVCDILAIYDLGRSDMNETHYIARINQRQSDYLHNINYHPLTDYLERDNFIEHFHFGLERLGILTTLPKNIQKQ